MKKEVFKQMVGANLCVRPIANFSIRVVTMMFIIAVITVSCGGGGGANKQQQSGNASETNTEQAAKINLADHYTAVERHKVDFVEDWMLPTVGILTKSIDNGYNTHQFTIGGMNKAQLDTYVKTLEAKGMKEGSSIQGDAYTNGTVTIIIDKRSFKEHGGRMETFNNGKNELFAGSYLDIYIMK